MLMPADLEDGGDDREIQKAWPQILERYFYSLQRVLDASTCDPFRGLRVVSTVSLLRYILLFKKQVADL